MSEGFLSRWSRRKQAALAAEPAKPPPQPEGAAAAEPAAESRAPESGVAAFDPSSLPSIESITAATDIRGFFAAGVPAELTRAALRRVWTSDPKIRDFVGLADYDWDFNAPGSMAGFGPLEGAEALRAQLAHRLGPVTAAEVPDQGLGAQPAARAPADSADERPEQASQISTEDERPQKTAGARAGGEATQPERQDAAQQAPAKPEDVQSAARRRHGGALPES
ncbi:MAG TPA: DUF3306 domain-containing protein [Xanthobacteraceae bacterium]|jgi:hypothetical protein